MHFFMRVFTRRSYTHSSYSSNSSCLMFSRNVAQRNGLSLSLSAEQARSKWWTLQQYQKRIIRAVYYWYSTRYSGRIMYFEVCVVLQPHLQPHGQHAHSNDSPTAHTQPTAQPNSTHATNRCSHEAYSAAPWITNDRDGWISPLTDRRPCSRGRARCVSVCCLVSVDEGTQTVAAVIFSRAYSPDEIIRIPHTE